jgi:hypothetical protein
MFPVVILFELKLMVYVHSDSFCGVVLCMSVNWLLNIHFTYV